MDSRMTSAAVEVVELAVELAVILPVELAVRSQWKVGLGISIVNLVGGSIHQIWRQLRR